MRVPMRNWLWMPMVLAMAAALSGGPKPMITYESRLDRSEFVSKEPIQLRLRITNDGSAAIELPDPSHPASDQPVFGVSGPGYREEKIFSSASLLRDLGGAPSPADTIRIEPRASWEGLYDLSSMVPMRQPGEYHVRSFLAFQNQRVMSETIAFQVRAAGAPSSIALGLGTRPLEVGQGECTYIANGQIYASRFDEDRPDIAEVHISPPIRRVAVARDAADVDSPARNSPFFNEMVRWIVWREGRAVKALSNTRTEPISLDMPEDLGSLVHPSLKTTGGPVEVLAISKDGNELSMVTVSSGTAGQNAAIRLAWQTKLPTPPAAITAAFGDGPQPRRHIAYAAVKGSGIEIFHASYASAETPQKFTAAAIPAVQLLASSRPAISIEPTGRVRVSVLTASALVTAEFEPDGAAGKHTISPYGELAGPVIAGGLLGERAIAVIEVEGHGVYRLNGDKAAPVAVPGTPTVPILLAPGARASYILYFEPDRGPHFEPLE